MLLEPLPTLRRPTPPPPAHARSLPARAALLWLAAGWRDLKAGPGASLAYGLFLVLLSCAVLWVLHAAGLLYLVLPAIAGFLIVGPFLAIGLYEKSRRLAAGETARLSDMLHFRPAAMAQLAFAGLLVGLLVLFWLRAADLLYALFFGLQPFRGATDALTNVLTTERGWALIVTGTLVGGLFAAFAFAISVFAFPMLVAQAGHADRHGHQLCDDGAEFAPDAGLGGDRCPGAGPVAADGAGRACAGLPYPRTWHMARLS